MWLPKILFKNDFVNVKVIHFLLFFSALRQIILVSGTLLKDDIHKVNVCYHPCMEMCQKTYKQNPFT